MRAAVHDRFRHSQGGGERHCGMIAVVLALRAHLAARAQARAEQWGEKAFADRWHDIAERSALVG